MPSFDPTQLDPAIATLLNIDPSNTTITKHGGSSFTRVLKITHAKAGIRTHYFLKTAPGAAAATMFAGEHASLSALSTAVPDLCPTSHGHGTLISQPSHSFLVTAWLDLSSSHSYSARGPSLAQKLGHLHSQPAPIPSGYSAPQFGFPVTTCCGETPQDNTWTTSWAEFFAERRLRAIMRRARETQGQNAEVERAVEGVCEVVVPRLLGDGHLGGKEGVRPVLVHGDLWSGNKGLGKLEVGGEVQAVVFDPSSCYAHSEYELGIMKMFGGFGQDFLDEYHSLVPKTEPVEEYDDRVKLYGLFHQLNHYAMFSGGYRSGAMGIMKELNKKYGSEKS